MNQRYFKCLLGLVLMSLFFEVSTVWATAPRYDYEFTERGQYEAESALKLQRGLTNTSLGWTEIFQTPVAWAQPIDRGAWKSAMVGIPVGIIRALGRTIVGVYEVVTFYAPQKPIFSDIQGDVR